MCLSYRLGTAAECLQAGGRILPTDPTLSAWCKQQSMTHPNAAHSGSKTPLNVFTCLGWKHVTHTLFPFHSIIPPWSLSGPKATLFKANTFPAHDPLWLLPIWGLNPNTDPFHSHSLPVTSAPLVSNLPFRSRFHQTNQVNGSDPSLPSPRGRPSWSNGAEVDQSRGRLRVIYSLGNGMQKLGGSRGHKPHTKHG